MLEEIYKNFIHHHQKQNTYITRISQEQSQDYSRYVEKIDTGRLLPWVEIIQRISKQPHGIPTLDVPSGLFTDLCTKVADKWNATCSGKPFHIAALSMAMGHLEKDCLVVLHMASLYIYLEAKDPGMLNVINDQFIPMLADDRRVVITWVKKIKSNAWNFADLYKYFSQTFLSQLRQKFSNVNSFKHNTMIYSL